MSSSSLLPTQSAGRSASFRLLCVTLMYAACAPEFAHAQSAPPAANSLNSSNIPIPADAPAWFAPSYWHALRAPLPVGISPRSTPPLIPQLAVFPDRSGWVSNYQPGGATTTASNAFFQSLGTNGRTCFTCHQTPNALSMSAEHAREVYAATGGNDPLFAPVDGANCPNQVSAASTSGALVGGRTGSATQTSFEAAHSLLLNRGLFRIFLPKPLPPQAEFTIELVSDPNGCNTDPAYNQEVDPTTGQLVQLISVYRRPLMSSNLKFKTMILADFQQNLPPGTVRPINPITGATLPIDPSTGLYESLNIMWDGREPTLQSQASDATLIHSQATSPPTSTQVQQMVDFENGIFSAQAWLGPVALWQGGAEGGAVYLSSQSPQETLPPPPPLGTQTSLAYYNVWSNISATTPITELKGSIARGQAIFETFPFPSIINLGNVVLAHANCSSCHSQPGGGEQIIVASQKDTGVGGQSAAVNGPAPDPTLPIFKLKCNAGVVAGSDGGADLTTNDPGLALITGRCQDIGRFTVPALRGLAARAPYFHDGSAATIMDVINFYDKRFTIGFTDQQKQDLANFLLAL
jgi:cytochrome c peroxidase